jgi:NTE family protein
LAAIGYKAEALKALILDELDFKDLLDDGGSDLESLTRVPTSFGFTSLPALWSYYRRNRRIFDRLRADYGLYKVPKLQELLIRKIKDQIPALEHNSSITFQDLKEHGCAALKIVASDLGGHEPLVFSASGGYERNGLVLDAIRASMSYPFVFCPVPINNNLLVDGGLTTNLPVFLFERERRALGVPVIAFDLIPEATNNQIHHLGHFCNGLATTALESTDILMRKMLTGVYHVPVAIPPTIRTLDFGLTRSQRSQLFQIGKQAATEVFDGVFKNFYRAQNEVEELQALHVPPAVIVPALKAIAKAFEANGARQVRANVSLPTERGTRIIVYQYGMEDDSDSDLELKLEAGCSGKAWENREPFVGNLIEGKRSYHDWGLTQTQQAKIRKDRRTMFCFPIFDGDRRATRRSELDNLNTVGVLSIDTSTPLKQTGWTKSRRSEIISDSFMDEGELWADTLSRILR